MSVYPLVCLYFDANHNYVYLHYPILMKQLLMVRSFVSFFQIRPPLDGSRSVFQADRIKCLIQLLQLCIVRCVKK